MIIITGIGRSGTSLVAEFCKQIGLSMGDISWIAKYNAGNELPAMTKVSKHILGSVTKGTDIECADKILRINHECVKDPLFMSHPKIVRIWWKYRKDIKVIYMKRDFNDIASSQSLKPLMNTPTYRCFPRIMKSHEESFIKTLETLGVPYQIVEFPGIIKEPKPLLEVLKRFSPRRLRGLKKKWDALADPSKVHTL